MTVQKVVRLFELDGVVLKFTEGAMRAIASEAIRRKKASSMRIAVDLVQQGRADGAVSSGNTGALTAISHFVLRCLPGVERAPIMSAVPNARGFTHMLDLGANTTATALQLVQFALMGAIVARCVDGIESPRVGLLNIGEEEIKGHHIVQEAHGLLRERAARQAESLAVTAGAVRTKDRMVRARRSLRHG